MSKSFYTIFYLIISISLSYSQEADSFSQVNASSINYDKYNLEYNKIINDERKKMNDFMSEERNKHDDLRQTIMTWSIAIAGMIIAILTAITTICIIIPFSIKKKTNDIEEQTKEQKERLDAQNKSIEEQSKLIKEQRELIDENSKKIKINSRKIGDDIKKRLLPFEQKLYDFKDIDEKKPSQDADILYEIIDNYIKNPQEIDAVRDELEKLLQKETYKSKRYQICYIIGFIYGDEFKRKAYINLEKINFEKAKYYYKMSLDILDDNKPENMNEEEEEKLQEFKSRLLNDLAYTEIELFNKLSEDKKSMGSKTLLEEAKKHLEEAIKILNSRNIKWAIPYKNKGYCLGKLATIEEDKKKQEKLLIQASLMYIRAISLDGTMDGPFEEALSESFKETIGDFRKFQNNIGLFRKQR